MRLLAVTAVDAEADAVVRDLGPVTSGHVGPLPARTCRTAAGSVDVVVSGVGSALAAAVTATALAHGDYDAVLSLGIAGGFDGRCQVGDLVVADRVCAADLGASSPHGFLTLDELGFGQSAVRVPGDHAGLAARIGATVGTILTLNTVTGTDERAVELAGRWEAVAEAMEGYGVWVAAGLTGVVPYEIRAISNRCGVRDRSAWNIPLAFDALARGCARLLAEEWT